MNLAVVGSRSIKNKNMVYASIDYVMEKENQKRAKIVSGGAMGVDANAILYARKKNFPVKIFLPNWEAHGKRAGLIRNTEIVNNSNVLLAIWDGESNGTRDSIIKAIMKKIPVYIIFPSDTIAQYILRDEGQIHIIYPNDPENPEIKPALREFLKFRRQ